MRLINVQTQLLEDFTLRSIPQYAILSHRWTDEEVTFQEFLDQDETTAWRKIWKKGFLKIRNTCQLAARHGIDYVWVDTCCIDKSSSAELSEAINSMWRYYKDAEVCFAYLSDLKVGANVMENLSTCEWFTRGWTLQELIAPKNLRFYDENWQFQGTKHTFAYLIDEKTNIPTEILRNPDGLDKFSIAERMTWASKRETTRIEDTAYCLLGIFDINMPLLYGEGNKAFLRLQQEIIKNNNDLSIFGWCPEDTGDSITIPCISGLRNKACNADCGHERSDESGFYSVLAPFPKEFANLRGRYVVQSVEHSVLNCGIKIDCHLLRVCLFGCDIDYCRCCSACRKYVLDVTGTYGIILNKIGPDTFIRSKKQLITSTSPFLSRPTSTRSIYLLTKAGQRTFCNMTLDVKQSFAGEVGVGNALPESNWDFAERRWYSRDVFNWGMVSFWFADDRSSDFCVLFETMRMEACILDRHLYAKEIALLSQGPSSQGQDDFRSILNVTPSRESEKSFCIKGRAVRVEAYLKGSHGKSFLVVYIEDVSAVSSSPPSRSSVGISSNAEYSASND